MVDGGGGVCVSCCLFGCVVCCVVVGVVGCVCDGCWNVVDGYWFF